MADMLVTRCDDGRMERQTDRQAVCVCVRARARVCVCVPYGAAVERRTGNREEPGSNLDRCTVICPTTRYEVSFIYRLIVAVAKSCVT